MKEHTPHYPMTAAQNILFYNQMFTVHKQVNNIYTLMLLEKELDFAVLRQAIGLAYRHNDALRIRLKRVDGRIVQHFLPEEPQNPQLLDFTGWAQDRVDRKLYKLASRPFRVLNRPMSRIWMVRSPEGQCGIYFGVSHIILDSWGICVLMKYVMDVYNALKDGTGMPRPPHPHEPLLIKDLEYQNTAQHQKDLEFWKQECAREEPWYTHVNGMAVLDAYRKKKRNSRLQGASGFTLRTRALHEVLTVPPEKVTKMEAFCTAHGLPMQVLFMMGVRTCLSKRNGRQKDVSFYTTVARRCTLPEKTSGGTRVHAMPFRTILAAADSFLAALGQLRDRQTAVYRHAGIDFLEIRKLMQDAWLKGDPMPSHQSVCLTFQPVRLTLACGTPLHTKWYCNGVSSQPFYLTIMDDDGTGGLRCYYEYQRSVVQRQTVLDFHEDMVGIIMAGIENPDITVGQLLDL